MMLVFVSECVRANVVAMVAVVVVTTFTLNFDVRNVRKPKP